MSATVASAADLANDQQLDLYLLVGQSNMSGRGKIEPADQVPDPHIWKLDASLKWVPAIDPLHFDKPTMVGVGPGMSFAREVLKAEPDHFIGLIPAAFGGTSIEEWAKGGKLYNDAVARCHAAQTHGTLRAILWHQGEADASPAKVATYIANLQKLASDFRSDLNAPDVPIIVGQLGPFYKAAHPFNEMLMANAPKSVPHCLCVSSDGLTDRGDQLHFDTASQHELGRRYAQAFLSLSRPATQPITP